MRRPPEGCAQPRCGHPARTWELEPGWTLVLGSQSVTLWRSKDVASPGHAPLPTELPAALHCPRCRRQRLCPCEVPGGLAVHVPQ